MNRGDASDPTRVGGINRRTWLRGAAATSGAAAVGGLPNILARAQAPAYPKGTKLHLLQWSHYVQAADVLFDQQAAEFAKQAGVQIQVERINQNDIQARVTAAVQAQTGPDIIIIANNHAQLYETSLADVSDVAEEIGRRQGGWYDYAKVNTFAGGHWIGVPQFIISWAITYREDWLEGAEPPVPRDVGRVPGGRARPEGQGAALRPGVRRQHQRPQQLVLPARLDVGRHGGRQGR